MPMLQRQNMSSCNHDFNDRKGLHKGKGKVKLAMKVHRVVRCRGSQFLQTIGSQITYGKVVSLTHLPPFTPQEDS
jgi:hypothetical protein